MRKDQTLKILLKLSIYLFDTYINLKARRPIWKNWGIAIVETARHFT